MPDALGPGFHCVTTPTGRAGSGVSRRQNALDPGFHNVPASPAHPDRDADGAGVSWVRLQDRTARPRPVS